MADTPGADSFYEPDIAISVDATLRAAARRNAKIIHPEPDCRTCANVSNSETYCHAFPLPCTNGDRYQALPPVRLYRSKT